MKTLRQPTAFRRRQQGISILTAIFLLLLFASISAFMASLMSTAHVTGTLDMEGSRTYQAARAGIEWGLYQLDPDGLQPGVPVGTPPDCFADTVLNQIPNYSVSVTCTRFPTATSYYEEGSRRMRLYEITATATLVSGRPPGVERVITVTAEKCRDPALVTTPPYDC